MSKVSASSKPIALQVFCLLFVLLSIQNAQAENKKNSCASSMQKKVELKVPSYVNHMVQREVGAERIIYQITAEITNLLILAPNTELKIKGQHTLGKASPFMLPQFFIYTTLFQSQLMDAEKWISLEQNLDPLFIRTHYSSIDNLLTEKQIKHLEIENQLSTKLKSKDRIKKLVSNPKQELALATMLSVSEMLENLPELKKSVNKIYELQKALFGIYDIKEYEETMIQIYTTAMENAMNIESDFNTRLSLYPEISQKNIAINTALKEIYEILSIHISDKDYKLTEYIHPDTGEEIDSSMILIYLEVLGFYQSSLADQYGLLNYKKSLDIDFLLSHSTSNFRNQPENIAFEVAEGKEFNEQEAYENTLKTLNDNDYRVFQNFMYVASKEPELLNDFKRIIALKHELQQYISVKEIETKITDILESLESYLDADNTTALSPEEVRDSIEELEAQDAKAKAKADIKDEDEIPAKNKLH